MGLLYIIIKLRTQGYNKKSVVLFNMLQHSIKKTLSSSHISITGKDEDFFVINVRLSDLLLIDIIISGVSYRCRPSVGPHYPPLPAILNGDPHRSGD